jgi:G3E family GTPase
LLEVKIRDVKEGARILRTTKAEVPLPLILSVGLFESDKYFGGEQRRGPRPRHHDHGHTTTTMGMTTMPTTTTTTITPTATMIMAIASMTTTTSIITIPTT